MTNKQIKGGIYTLEVGDQFYVKLKNSSTTMAGAIFNAIISTSSTERIVVNYGGIVKTILGKSRCKLFYRYIKN